MYQFETKIRVRYGETDKMGYLYHGYYALLYEQARVDAMRNIGVVYKKMEDDGVLMPVAELRCKYIRPAYYDELLTVKASIRKIPAMRVHMDYEIYNEKNELLNVGETTLAFIDSEKMKAIHCPQFVIDALMPYFKSQS